MKSIHIEMLSKLECISMCIYKDKLFYDQKITPFIKFISLNHELLDSVKFRIIYTQENSNLVLDIMERINIVCVGYKVNHYVIETILQD